MTVVQKSLPIAAGEGVNLGAIGLGIFVKMLGADTGGAYSLFEYVIPAGLGGPPPHVHTRQDELFICVQGTVRILLDHDEHDLPAGSVMMLPRDVRHQFWNATDEETRVIAVVSPPGLEDYYRDLSALPPGPRDITKISAVMAEHGLRLAPE